MKKLFAAALLGASVLASAPAAAATFIIAPGTFTVPPGGFGNFGNGFLAETPSFTDYYNFALAASGPASASSGLQSVTLSGTGVTFSAVSLWSGSVVGDVVSVGATKIADFTLSGGGLSADLTDQALATGDFFIQVSGAAGATRNYTGNLVVAPGAVPEPATWGLMILGFGLVGSAMRNRRRAIVAA